MYIMLAEGRLRLLGRLDYMATGQVPTSSFLLDYVEPRSLAETQLGS
jgi:hypothetical protein